MYGAICGDTVGSVWEFAREKPEMDFELFPARAGYTDDSIMTLAIAEAVMDSGLDASEEVMKEAFVKSMQKWGRSYWTGYGQRFMDWIHSDDPKPYNSWGNGSAMRASAIGWLYKDYPIKKAREVAKWSADVTHNHPEGIKGAESTVSAIWLALNGKSKNEIKEYIEKEFGYDLNLSEKELRKDYAFDVSCQGTVPVAVFAFLKGSNFEECIRKAIWYGGDSDTIGAICGGIAEAFYGIPENLKRSSVNKLPEEMHQVIDRFNELCKGQIQEEIHIKTKKEEFKIKKITLLCKDDYERYKKEVRQVNDYWWLKNVDTDYPTLISAVDRAGGIAAIEPKNKDVGIRPVLVIEVRRLFFGTIPVKNFELFGHSWTMIGDNIALCDEIIEKKPFNSTIYQYSSVKEYLDEWFKEKTGKETKK